MKMTENERFQIDGEEVIDTLGIIPRTMWGVKECQEKYCKELNQLHRNAEEYEKDNKRLIEFIKSKGYNLKDYLEFIGGIDEW